MARSGGGNRERGVEGVIAGEGLSFVMVILAQDDCHHEHPEIAFGMFIFLGMFAEPVKMPFGFSLEMKCPSIQGRETGLQFHILSSGQSLGANQIP
jgi:hypothetical protein